MDKLIPVVVIKEISEVDKILPALKKSNINCAEITFRTACAKDAIEYAVKNYPDMNIGAGTVINAEQCKQALKVGAKFIVSPGLSPAVAKICAESKIPYYPGCVTPTEIMQAIADGLDTVKFFPAKEFGGLATMKSLSAPFSGIRFMPTGGISLDNLKEFASAKFVIACGGTYMVKENLINEKNYEEITRLSKLSTDIIKEVK